MYKFICEQCGKDSYSSAQERYQINPACPYCGYNKRAKEKVKKFTTTNFRREILEDVKQG